MSACGSLPESKHLHPNEKICQRDPQLQVFGRIYIGHSMVKRHMMQMIHYYKNQTAHWYIMNYDTPTSFNRLLGLKFEQYNQVLYDLKLFKRKTINDRFNYSPNEKAFKDWANLKHVEIEIESYQKKEDPVKSLSVSVTLHRTSSMQKHK